MGGESEECVCEHALCVQMKKEKWGFGEETAVIFIMTNILSLACYPTPSPFTQTITGFFTHSLAFSSSAPLVKFSSTALGGQHEVI